MAQILLPDSDVATGSWTATPLWSKVDDDSTVNASGDGTTIASDNNTAPDNADFTLSDGTDPESSTGHILRARWNKDSTGGHAITAVLELWQGTAGSGTLIATLSVVDIGATEVESTYTLSGAEADAITNYADLQLRLSRQGDTGGNPNSRRSLVVDLIEFEIPDAAAPSARMEASFAELETPETPTRIEASFAEIEFPDPSARMEVSFVELETPETPTRIDASFAELEAPESPTRMDVSFVELEAPESPTRFDASFAELEMPESPTRIDVSHAELETPDVGAGDPARMEASHAELEMPDSPTRLDVAFVELETLDPSARLEASFAELEMPESPTRIEVSFADLQTPNVGGESAERKVKAFIPGQLLVTGGE